NVLKSGGNTQTQLLKVQPVNSSSFWISENNLSTFTSTVPDNKYTITQEFNLKNTNQQVSVNNSLISIGTLTGINKDKADNVIKLPGSIIMTAQEKANTGTKGESDFEFPYTFFDNTNIENLSYYIYDHLGNTRVVYSPVSYAVSSGVINEKFNEAAKFSSSGTGSYNRSCTTCSPWVAKAYTTISYDNTGKRIKVNSTTKNQSYSIGANFPTIIGKRYKVS